MPNKILALIFTLASASVMADTSYPPASCQTQSTCIQHIGNCVATALSSDSSYWLTAAARAPYSLRNNMVCITYDGKTVNISSTENFLSDVVFGLRIQSPSYIGNNSAWIAPADTIQQAQASAIANCNVARTSLITLLQAQYSMCSTN